MTRILAIALGIAAVAFGCGQHTAPNASAPLRVVVAAPQRRDMQRTISLPGDLVGFTETPLHAKVTGYLRRIDVDKGDRVRKGQVVAVLEVPELQQQLERARAEHDVKRLTAQRLERVWHEDARLIAREEVDIAAGASRAAAAEVQRLEALVAYTTIVAPIDGVVTARYVDPGALIAAAGQIGTVLSGGAPMTAGPAPVVTIADIDTLRVYVYVPETDAGSIAIGQPATLRVAQFAEREFHGTVTRFANALDLRTRTMLAEIDLANPDHALYPGMSVHAVVEVERHPGVLTLPVTAVGQSPEGTYVLAVQNDRLVRVSVRLGLRDEGIVEITSGVRDDTPVARYLSAQLTDGMTVAPVTAAAPWTPSSDSHP